MSLDRDLGRWEAGEISPEELKRLHPDTAVETLVALHERLSAIADEGAPDAEAAMERMLRQLPDRARPAQRRSSRVLLLAAAAVLLTASMAVAMPGVRDGVSGLAHGVGRLFGADSVSPPPPMSTIDRGHPGTPGEGRGVDEPVATASHEPGSADGDDQSGDSSESAGPGDDQDGSSESSGGDPSAGDGGSQDQRSDGQGSDGQSSGGDGGDQDNQPADRQATDGGAEES
ncbi:MAG: hypothetical protein M3P10_00795 [Actinomycetota bacterium]|nr:hypothetical protein [Actinomycetota bacterium]